MRYRILLFVPLLFVCVGCKKETYPVVGQTGGLPPANSRIGKTIREGMARRGGVQPPGVNATPSK